MDVSHAQTWLEAVACDGVYSSSSSSSCIQQQLHARNIEETVIYFAHSSLSACPLSKAQTEHSIGQLRIERPKGGKKINERERERDNSRWHQPVLSTAVIVHLLNTRPLQKSLSIVYAITIQ